MNARERRRYSRHLLIPQIGLAGQEQLARSRVLVVGAGGLGSPALQYLAAAGVGRIGIVDDDAVDETNLQRQTIFGEADIGRSKAVVAAERLRALNSSIAIDPIAMKFAPENACDLVAFYDVVLDCTDRFATRYLINDACYLQKRPEVYGSIFRFDGQVTLFDSAGGPCYRCLYPEPPPPQSQPTCAEGGVLGVLAGIVGTWQGNEALKKLLGIGQSLAGRLMLVDALSSRVREVSYEADPSCALCGERPSIEGIVAQRYLEPAAETSVGEIDAEDLDQALHEAILLDVREPHEAVLGSVDGAIRMPASQLEARMHELNTAIAYVVACRVGVKSRWAAHRLRDAGFTRLLHLRGGLLAYAAAHHEFEFF